MAVTGYDGPAQDRWDDSRLPADLHDLGGGSEDDSRDRGITGELIDRLESEDLTVLGLVKTARFAIEGVEIDVNRDVRFLPTHDRGLAPSR